MPDYRDAKYAFHIQEVERKLFEEQFPDADPCDWGVGQGKDDWIGKDTVTLAEYYEVRYEKKTLWEVDKADSIGIVWRDDLSKEERASYKDHVSQEREVEIPFVVWNYMSPKEVLKQVKLPIKNIPLVPMVGKEAVIDGIWSCKGLVRDIKDLQQLYNFWVSQETELISLAPRVPWIVAEGQIDDYAELYENAHTRNIAYLPYKPVSHGGTMAPAPHRADFSGVPIGIVTAKQEIVEDMKAVTGIYDASMGNRSNETSGVAIRAREAQGDVANFHFPDNYSVCLTQVARIINDYIPTIYNNPDRLVTILGEEDGEDVIKVGSIDDKGKQIDFGSGDYDINVTIGASFNSQREEQVQTMLEYAKAIPAIGQGAADVMIRKMDWTGKDEIAERAKRILEMQFPGLTAPVVDQEEDQEQAMMMEQMKQTQQQMQQLAQQNQQLTEQIQKLDQSKVMSEQQKQQNEKMKLELENKRIEIDQALRQQELQLQAKAQELDMMKADLATETDLKKSDDKNQLELIKLRESKKEVPKEAPKEEKKEKPQPTNVNLTVNGSKVKESVITGPMGQKSRNL
jgi:hypothetical protein